MKTITAPAPSMTGSPQEVDDADGVDSAILTAADVVDDREFAVGRDLDVERVEAGGHVVILAVYLGVADLLAVDVEQSYPVGAALGDERALAVGGDCDGDGQCRGGAATAGVGWVATDTVPTGFTFLPSIASAVTESSARLATSAN